jgi:hypothetical protein
MLVYRFPLLNSTKGVCLPCAGVTQTSREHGMWRKKRASAIRNYLYWLTVTLLSSIEQFVRGAGSMEAEHLTYQIRELCARAIMAEDSEVEAISKELQAALRAHARLMLEQAKILVDAGLTSHP